MLRLIIFSPIYTSLYTKLVLYLLSKEDDMEIVGVVVRSPWNYQRFRSEFRRDGIRLIKKIIKKYLLRQKSSKNRDYIDLSKYAREIGLPDKSIKSITKESNIPYWQVSDLNDEKNQKLLEKMKPDLIIFTGGGLIRKKILSIPKFGILNCHSGLLPQYRGMDVIEWTALENNIDSVGFGVTLHYMERGVDTGPILLKNKIIVSLNDSFISIRDSLEVEMVKTMINGVCAIRDNNIKPVEQDIKDGRQYFVMHPRIKELAKKNLEK